MLTHNHSHHPFVDKDVPWLLRAQVEIRGDQECLIWEPFSGNTKSWTYLQLHKEATQIAVGLANQGIEKGNHVLIHMNNCPEFLLAWHACAMLGAVAVTTNTRSAAPEMEYFIEHSAVKGAITQPQFVDMIASVSGQLEWIVTTDQNSDETETDTQFPTIPFKQLYQNADSFSEREVDPMLPLSIQYTSGTTSRPKGVVWTHANALYAGLVGSSNNEINETDCNMVFTPLYHTNAMSWGYFPTFWVGGKIILQARFSASNFWPIAVKHKCTWANVIPFAALAVLQQPIPKDHHFKRWIVGAGNLGEVPGIGPIEKILGVRWVGAWGMTETIIHGTYTPLNLPIPSYSMGMSMPYLPLKVVDEQNKLVRQGETGLLKVLGTPGISLFLAYYNDKEKTEGSFDEDGWFDTGDRVTLVENGHYRFADRAKDMLRVGGENVAASEIETIVKSVQGVMDCAVVAKPDKMRGELPVAFVRSPVPSDTLKTAIIDTCKTNLADFKVPVDVIFVDDFPRAELEKVAKHKLRDRLK